MYNVQCAMYNAVPAVGMRISVVLVGAATVSTGQILHAVTLYATSGRKEKMREILFRGKRVDNGEWETGSLLVERMNTSDQQVMIADKMTGYPTLVLPETVGQYTGLTDKNDTKIFEGDIIRDEDGDIMVVKWLKTSAAFVLEPKPFASIYFYGTLSSRIEVIGNIHDNPELLERGAKNE